MREITKEQKDRFWSKVEKNDGACWLWKGAKSKRGYGTVNINYEVISAHRAAFLITNGYLPKIVCHSCDNTNCVNPAHLWAGTQKDNIQDMRNKNRGKVPSLKGSKNPSSKLSEDDVLKIRELFKTNRYTQIELGKQFDVSNAIISKIVRNELWVHVKTE